MEDVRLSSASVKTLTINLCDCLNTLSFDAPSLLQFDYYSGSVPSDYPLVNMENLVDAKIEFCVLSVWSELVPVFNNLKSLAVKSDEDRGWMASNSSSSKELSTFRNSSH
ncbi:hypothetical protein Bca4012_100749 [Brassica carinata]